MHYQLFWGPYKKRILLFRVLYLGPLFSETSILANLKPETYLHGSWVFASFLCVLVYGLLNPKPLNPNP